MNKLMNWMFAAILLCGTVMCGLTSCSEESKMVEVGPIETTDLYTLKTSYEIISTGDLSADDVSKVKTVLNVAMNGSITDRKTLSDAKLATDEVVKTIEGNIKAEEWYVNGLKYNVYAKLYNSKEELVYSRTITVENDQISTK